jgi:hypothetical protein
VTPADEFWHELVLSGVGGRTIEEAKERMSYAEALDWAAYMRKRGPLNVGMRIEVGFAMLAVKIDRALGGKMTLNDFMPWSQHTEEPDREATLDDVMSILMGARR